MPVAMEGPNLGDLLKYEAPNLYSREQVTVVAGQVLALGAVVGMVTATGKMKGLDPSATDGSQVPAGVMLEVCDASAGERDDGLMVARHAIVMDTGLRFPAGITAAEKLAAVQALKQHGILVRRGV